MSGQVVEDCPLSAAIRAGFMDDYFMWRIFDDMAKLPPLELSEPERETLTVISDGHWRSRSAVTVTPLLEARGYVEREGYKVRITDDGLKALAA